MNQRNKIEELYSNFIETMMNIEAFRSDTDSSYISYKYNVEKVIDWAKKNGDKTDKESISLFERKLINLPKFSKLIYSMTIVYSVSKFEAYLNGCLEVLIDCYPNVLKSNKQMTYKEIFEFNNIRELHNMLKNKELIEFSYSSFNEKVKILEKKFNLKFESNDFRKEVITEILTTRNIHLHNDGIINEVYLENNPDTDFTVGEEREISIEYTIQVIFELMKISKVVFNEIKSKIKI